MWRRTQIAGCPLLHVFMVAHKALVFILFLVALLTDYCFVFVMYLSVCFIITVCLGCFKRNSNLKSLNFGINY